MAAHPLDDGIDAGAVHIRPVLAEPGNAGIDDARIDRLDGLVVNAQSVLHVGTVILDDHIGVARQLLENVEPFGELQIQGHRPFVTVQILEIRAVAIHEIRGSVAGLSAGPVRRIGEARTGRGNVDDQGRPPRRPRPLCLTGRFGVPRRSTRRVIIP